MQALKADTEWNDVLRQKGVIPANKEKEISESTIISMVDNAVKEQTNASKTLEDYSLDELDLVEDDEDERILLEYRLKRIAEMKAEATKCKYGDVQEISAEDYVEQVNKAGSDVWVILHLYKQGIPQCSIINHYLNQLAMKFPATKFLKSVSDTCIPNFPDKNLPAIFIYFEGTMKKKMIGPDEVGGMNLKLEELEWMLSEAGAVKSDLEYNPRKQINDVLLSQLKDDCDDDW